MTSSYHLLQVAKQTAEVHDLLYASEGIPDVPDGGVGDVMFSDASITSKPKCAQRRRFSWRSAGRHAVVSLAFGVAVGGTCGQALVAPEPAPASSASASASDLPRYDALTPETVDFFIPVITMEQFFSRQTRLPGYRIQIFKSGKVLYQGMRFVKTLGEVELRIAPKQVEEIQSEFAKYKFWQVPPDQYGLPRGQGVLVLQFTLRDGERVKTLRFGNNGLPDMLQHVIDSEVDTTKLRCPFLDEATNLERCEIQHQSIQGQVRSFLSYDFPKLLELYK